MAKHSRPDISNCVRDLSKVLDTDTDQSYNEMLRIIHHVLEARDYGLRFTPYDKRDDAWHMICYADSDYAGDQTTRHSITEYITYINGVPICWRSKAQRCIALISCEAECVVLSEGVTDIVFVINMCEEMKIEPTLPVKIYVENIEAIFITSNPVATTSK